MSLKKLVNPAGCAFYKCFPMTRSISQKPKFLASMNKDIFSVLTNARPMSVKINTSMLLKYESVKNLSKRTDSMIIDVRDPAEFAVFGEIPGSVNIPLRDLDDALRYSDEQFELKYCRKKPCKGNYIVFTCTNGVRSIKALQKALNKGYSLSYVYSGGIEDWAKNLRCDIIEHCDTKDKRLPSRYGV